MNLQNPNPQQSLLKNKHIQMKTLMDSPSVPLAAPRELARRLKHELPGADGGPGSTEAFDQPKEEEVEKDVEEQIPR